MPSWPRIASAALVGVATFPVIFALLLGAAELVGVGPASPFVYSEAEILESWDDWWVFVQGTQMLGSLVLMPVASLCVGIVVTAIARRPLPGCAALCPLPAWIYILWPLSVLDLLGLLLVLLAAVVGSSLTARRVGLP